MRSFDHTSLTRRRITDRYKDVIIRGGENIASAEVENAVYADTRIAECAAVPVPNNVLGELVAVGVSLRPGATATARDIMAQAAARLRAPARPVFVHVYDDALPRNANGKIVKTDIKTLVQELYLKDIAENGRAKL